MPKPIIVEVIIDDDNEVEDDYDDNVNIVDVVGELMMLLLLLFVVVVLLMQCNFSFQNKYTLVTIVKVQVHVKHIKCRTFFQSGATAMPTRLVKATQAAQFAHLAIECANFCLEKAPCFALLSGRSSFCWRAR